MPFIQKNCTKLQFITHIRKKYNKNIIYFCDVSSRSPMGGVWDRHIEKRLLYALFFDA